MKILIVEDEPSLSKTIATYLKQENYLCDMADSFKEALDKIDYFDFDCILLAVRHTNINGEIFIKNQIGEFAVSNTRDSKSLQEEKLFQRFQSQSGNPESIGLGLEICRQICLVSGLHLRYEFLDNRHSFIISINPENFN